MSETSPDPISAEKAVTESPEIPVPEIVPAEPIVAETVTDPAVEAEKAERLQSTRENLGLTAPKQEIPTPVEGQQPEAPASVETPKTPENVTNNEGEDPTSVEKKGGSPEKMAESKEDAEKKERAKKGEELEKATFKEKVEAATKKAGKGTINGALGLAGGGVSVTALGALAVGVGGLSMAASNFVNLGVMTSPGMASAFIGPGALAMGGGFLTACLGNFILEAWGINLIKSVLEDWRGVVSEISPIPISFGGGGKKGGGAAPKPAGGGGHGH